MMKENVPLKPIGRITRARAAAYVATIGKIPPKPCTRQTQKEFAGGNLKRSAPNENSSVPVTAQNKRRAVLKEVTNVLCENSYKSCVNAAKIQTQNCKQALKSHMKKGSKVAPAVATEVQHLREKLDRKTAEETAKRDVISAEIQQIKENMQKMTTEETNQMGVVESQNLTVSVEVKENIPLVITGNSITEHGVADTQPRGHIFKKHAENMIILSKGEVFENLKGAPNIINIDYDLKDPLLCSLYAPDIYRNLRVTELMRRPSSSFMETVQRDITQCMRGILIDWLVEVTEEYKLSPDTLYLTVYLIDRFLSHNIIERQRLQLLGVTCMLLASKYEDICAPRVEEFCFITDNTYTKKEVVAMESKVLNYLEFQLSTPTIKTFLRRFLRAAHASYGAQGLELEYLANYLSELSLVEYDFLNYLPSLVAASAIFLARWTLDQSSHPWNPTLEHYTIYKASDLKCTVLALQNLQKNTNGCSLNSIRDKYRQEKFKCVASLLSPEVPEYLYRS